VNDPLWYKDAIIYEVHVRAYRDLVGDGIGDFRGLTSKLAYLEDLGVTALWILPFYPSPLRDDGYDISDYSNVHKQYGTLDDFKELLAEAHRRGLRVITELVINHTSDQHPWFQRARRAPPGSVERDFYVWSDTAEKYKDARIIFKDFEPSNWSWDHVAKAYYWHRFYSHQPDLNYDNPAVWDAILPLLDSWMEMGVDGMRLDAIPYLYEREGTTCENLPETHVFLKALRKRMEEKYPGRMFLAEANQWPEDAVAYFGDGDECHMSFHFPLMPRLFMALHQEDRFPILDILAQTPPIPESCQWCLFLRNHDELTLEMVTDEERDYMYRAYASDRTARINLGIRRRLAPLLGNDRRRIELMNALLFSLPGTPVIYYGDEIGMGDNIYLGDRNGVRTPMQWSGDRNAGFSSANPQALYLPVITDAEYHYQAVNVEAQQANPSSLLWWMKRLIALRKRYLAFGRGSIEFLHPVNTRVLAFLRTYQEERLLIVANLSRFVQLVDLDLRQFRGTPLIELFGQTPFPPPGDEPYRLTLGPHSFYWFSIAQPSRRSSREDRPLSVLAASSLDEVFGGPEQDRLEKLLPEYLGARLPKRVTSARVRQATQVQHGGESAWLTILQADYREGVSDRLFLPLLVEPASAARRLLEPTSQAALARLGGHEGELVVDALASPEYCRAVLRAIESSSRLKLPEGELACVGRPELQDVIEKALATDQIVLHRGENNSMTVHFGQAAVLRSFRRLDEGPNPDLELGEALARAGFDGVAPILGHTELRSRRRGIDPMTISVLHAWVPHQATAWRMALDQVSSFFERVAANREANPSHLLNGVTEHRLLGSCTARLHAALASLSGQAFEPEPYTSLYRRSLYQSLRNAAGRLTATLRMPGLPKEAEELLARLPELGERIQGIVRVPVEGIRIRCHGDYHLAQLLYTGSAFVLTDLEGDPIRTLGERRYKRSPFFDIAGMINSLVYAAGGVLLGMAGSRGAPQGVIRDEDRAALEQAAEAWLRHSVSTFLAGYLESAPRELLPPDGRQRATLLDILMLEKAMVAIEREAERRPSWAVLPIRMALRLLNGPPALGLIE
jgi:maltose alpha-D-glucosyltransferase/alpha-amylase